MITEKQDDRIIALLERIAESVERPTIFGYGEAFRIPIGYETPDPCKMVPFGAKYGEIPISSGEAGLMTGGPAHVAVERDIQYPRGETPHVVHVDEAATLPT